MVRRQMLIYNALVQERMYFLGFFRKFGGKLPPIDQKYSHLINREDGAYAWMHKVPSQIFRNGAVLHKKAWSITLPVLLDSQSRKGLKGQTVHFGSRRNCFPLNKCPKIGMSYLWGPKRFPEAGSFSRHIGLSLNQYRFT